MDEQVNDLREQAEAALDQAADLGALAEWKSQYLGDKGALTGLLRGIGQLPKEERPGGGADVSTPPSARSKAGWPRRPSACAPRASRAPWRPSAWTSRCLVGPARVGTLHIVTQTMRDILAAFAQMGFAGRARGRRSSWTTTTSSC